MSADKQSDWGRVAEDGTVYVRTADGERSVGSYEAGTPEEAQAALQALRHLQADCAQGTPAARPLFADIAQRLAQCRPGG